MHVTQIVRNDSTRVVGPAFFSGESPHHEYSTLSKARVAAKKWCEQRDLSLDDHKIVSSVVGWL